LVFSGSRIPLNAVEISYQAIQMISIDSNLNIHHRFDYNQFASLIWVVNPPTSHDFVNAKMPSDETILESMTKLKIIWGDIQHRSFCLPLLESLEVGTQRIASPRYL
jgi:hypothetical protein